MLSTAQWCSSERSRSDAHQNEKKRGRNDAALFLTIYGGKSLSLTPIPSPGQWRAKRNRIEEYFLKRFIQIALLIISLSITSCFRPATPDDDLASAILLGDTAAVQQALDRGANVTRVYQDGTTPLMHACREYKNYHGEAGADVSVAVKADLKNSQTSMDVQVRDAHASHSSQTVKGNREIVELLIARGADVHAKNKEGQTALSLAIRNNLPEVAEILREAGAKE